DTRYPTPEHLKTRIPEDPNTRHPIPNTEHRTPNTAIENQKSKIKNPTPNIRSRPRRRRVSAYLLLALSTLLANLSGCANNFSGGSFPIGKAAIVGRVVSAEDPQIVFRGVKITLLSTPPGGQSERRDAITDANGNFHFEEVPTGQVSGAAQLTAVANDTTIR